MKRIVGLIVVLVLVWFFVGCASAAPALGVDYNPPSAERVVYIESMPEDAYRARVGECYFAVAWSRAMVADAMQCGNREAAARWWRVGYSALKAVQRMAKVRDDQEDLVESLEIEQSFLKLLVAVKEVQ